MTTRTARLSRSVLGCGLGLALATVAGPAAEAQPAQPDFKAAAAHYQAAEAAMAREAWDEAAREYGSAYDLTRDPILHFKIGSAQARAGRCDAAGKAFDRYLADGNPSPEYRALADERRAACKPGGTKPPVAGGGDPVPGGGDQPGGRGTLPGAGVVPPPDGTDDPDLLPSLGAGGPSFTDTPSTWKRGAGWISTGATVGLVAVGVVLTLSAEGSEEDLQALIDFRAGDMDRPLRWTDIDEQYLDLVDEGARFDRLATYTFAVAGVTAAAAVTFFVLDAVTGRDQREGLATTIRPQVDRDGARVDVGWAF